MSKFKIGDKVYWKVGKGTKVQGKVVEIDADDITGRYKVQVSKDVLYMSRDGGTEAILKGTVLYPINLKRSH